MYEIHECWSYRGGPRWALYGRQQPRVRWDFTVQYIAYGQLVVKVTDQALGVCGGRLGPRRGWQKKELRLRLRLRLTLMLEAEAAAGVEAEAETKAAAGAGAAAEAKAEADAEALIHMGVGRQCSRRV